MNPKDILHQAVQEAASVTFTDYLDYLTEIRDHKRAMNRAADAVDYDEMIRLLTLLNERL